MGKEVQAVEDVHSRWTDLVEAKAGQTAASGVFSMARRVREVLQEIRPCDATVVFGGDLSQKQNEVELIPWSSINEHPWA